MDATLHWSPKGDRLAVHYEQYAGECREDGVFAIFRTTGEQICAFQEGFGLEWSPGGGRLLFRCDGGAHMWNLAVCDNAGCLRTRFALGSYDPHGGAWSPDGRRLATIVNDPRTARPVAIDLLTLTRPD